MRRSSVVLLCLSVAPNTRRKPLYTLPFAPFETGQTPTFEANAEELCRLLRAAGELPSDPTRTLRLRRERVSVRSKVYYEISADMSDNTTQRPFVTEKGVPCGVHLMIVCF